MKKFENENREYVWVEGYLWVKDDNGDTHLKNAEGRWACLGECLETEAESLAAELEALNNN